MTPTAIIRDAQADRVRLTLSPSGTIKATGNAAAVNRWLAEIRERKAEIIEVLKVGAGDTASASGWWLIHYLDRDPLKVAFSPAVTDAEVLAWYQDAVAAEPVAPIVRQPSDTLSAEEERAVLRWLAHIGEQDPATIAEVLSACRRDVEARRYFLERAERRPTRTNIADSRTLPTARTAGTGEVLAAWSATVPAGEAICRWRMATDIRCGTCPTTKGIAAISGLD